MDIPSIDYSLLVTLPRLIDPDLQRLREAIEHDDPTGAGTRSPPSPSGSTPHNNEHDSPTPSSDSATSTASTAAKPPTRSLTSTKFIAASLLEAVAVSVGVSRTPGGLHIAA